MTVNTQYLLASRCKVINDYPGNEIPVGTFLFETNKDWWTDGEKIEFSELKSFFVKYPNIFQFLPWHIERTLHELMSVEYVRITVYTGYWVVGDIVKVDDYKIDTKNKKLIHYIFEGTQISLPERCEPATIHEYNTFLKNEKSRY